MRKFILSIFVLAMLFEFTGCIKDAPHGSSNPTGSEEPEWHAGNWYKGELILDSLNNPHVYFSWEEVREANVDEESCYYRDCFYLDNPEFSECVKAELYNLGDGEMFNSAGAHTMGRDVNSLMNESGAIIRNRAIIVPVTPWQVSLVNDRPNHYNTKAVYYFDDGTTLTYYYARSLD